MCEYVGGYVSVVGMQELFPFPRHAQCVSQPMVQPPGRHGCWRDKMVSFGVPTLGVQDKANCGVR